MCHPGTESNRVHNQPLKLRSWVGWSVTELKGAAPGEVCEHHQVADGTRPVVNSDSLLSVSCTSNPGLEVYEKPLLLKQNRGLKRTQSRLQQLTAECLNQGCQQNLGLWVR